MPVSCKSKTVEAFLRNADNSVFSFAGIPNIFLIVSTNSFHILLVAFLFVGIDSRSSWKSLLVKPNVKNSEESGFKFVFCIPSIL